MSRHDRERGRSRSRERGARRSRSRGGRRSRSRDRGGRRSRSGGHRRRRRNRSGSTTSSQSRRRKILGRKTLWDVVPDGAPLPPMTAASLSAAGGLNLPFNPSTRVDSSSKSAPPPMMGVGTRTLAAAAPVTGASGDLSMVAFGNKRSREVWVGNLLQGAVTPQHLKDFFTQMFNALPEYQEKYHNLISEGKSAVKEIKMNEGATYAFVEFWTEEIAVTALEGFNLVEFMGRPIKTGRPTGFTAGTPQPPPLNLTPLRQVGLLPGASIVTEPPGPQSVQTKKQRELYFGNLPQGQLTSESVRELLTPACELLPEYNSAMGAPILSVNMSSEGKFCFVEFQNDQLATAAMPIFNGMEIFGRKMTVARPTGYIDGSNPNAAALAMLNAAGAEMQNVPSIMAPPEAQPVSGAMAAGALAVSGLSFNG